MRADSDSDYPDGDNVLTGLPDVVPISTLTGTASEPIRAGHGACAIAITHAEPDILLSRMEAATADTGGLIVGSGAGRNVCCVTLRGRRRFLSWVHIRLIGNAAAVAAGGDEAKAPETERNR